MNKFKLILLGLIVLNFSFLACFEDCESQIINDYKDIGMSGLVQSKYVSSNHAAKKISLSQNNKSILIDIPKSDVSGLWDYINIGDYISKRKGSMMIDVKRGNDRKSFNLRCR